MEQLNSDFILSGDEIDAMNLFDEDVGSEPTNETQPPDNTGEENNEEKTTEEEVNPDDLFSPESVGSENNNEDDKEKENTTSTEDGSSPKSNFYYSIANALVEEGILSNLDENEVKEINSAESFAEAIEKHVNAKLDEKQRRINSALEANIEPDAIRQYEGVINYLENISDDAITDESENGEKLRKQLIYQDFINRNYSKERAAREVKKSFDSGSDIEDAKEALLSNKEFYTKQYNDLIEEGQKAEKEDREKLKKEASELRKSLLEDKEVFEGISIDKSVRQRAYENITKPVYKTDDGEMLTAIQKYELDNPVEFRKKLSILFTLTDGFKDLNMIVKDKVKKEVKNSLRELEHTLKNTNKPKGNPTFVGGVSEDPESYVGNGWNLDI